MNTYNFVMNGISQIFFVQRRNDRSRQRRLDFVAIFIDSRDIRGQTRKLSLNVLNFERFLPSQILRGSVPPNVVPTLTPRPRGASSAKVSSGYTS